MKPYLFMQAVKVNASSLTHLELDWMEPHLFDLWKRKSGRIIFLLTMSSYSILYFE